MRFEHLQDLIASEELHFTRADRFTQDENEGIPPEDYLRRVLGTRRFQPEDERTLNHHIGTLAQVRETFYVQCWTLFRHEKLEMWDKFAPTNGVAICSRYELLEAAMDAMLDTTHVGLMRYGEEHLQTVNILQFINTKRKHFEDECEVRAIVECPHLFSGNRHYASNNYPQRRPLCAAPRWVPDFKRRRIDLKALLIAIVVSPFASGDLLEAAKAWAEARNHSLQVRRSTLAIG